MRTRTLMAWLLAGTLGAAPALAACQAEVETPVIDDGGTPTPDETETETPDDDETETPDDDETTVEGEVETEDE